VKRALLALVLAIAAGAAVVMWRTGQRPHLPDLDFAFDDDPPDAAVAEIPTVPPPPPLGRSVDIALFGDPVGWYGAGPSRPAADGADAPEGEVRRAVADAAAGSPLVVLFDPDLSRAAAEVAFQTARLGAPPPEAAMGYLLHAAGAPEIGAAVFVTHTTRDDDAMLADTCRRALASPPPGDGPLRVGVGEAASPGDAFTRHLAVLVARRDWEMVPAPTHVPPGATWTALVTVAPGWSELTARALGADGVIAPASLRREGDQVALAIVAPATRGAVEVAIDGVGPRGPGKLLQLTVWIGDPPRQSTVTIPDPDPPRLSDDDASARALGLLLADRAAVGAPPLAPDPALAAIARGHNLDMRDAGFFGHRSPTRGEVVDRLAAAGYRAVASGENLARNDSLGEAQVALMRSIGHRANIVEPRFTHVGVSAVRDGNDWLVTQVFARPVEALPSDAAERIVARIGAERAGRGLPPLVVRGALAQVAARHAPAVAATGVAGATDRVSEEIRPLVAHAAVVSTHQVAELGEIALPDAALDATMTEIGTAAYQDGGTGRVGAVIVVAR
jgi:uncharacterized protein YkwD